MSPLRLLPCLVVFGLAACAPDSVRNYEAHGLNKYLDKIQTVCAGTRLGDHELGEWLRSGTNDSDSDYVYWLDQTSRLYYNRISVPAYRDSVAGALGGAKPNAEALDCIVKNLPPDRPTKVPGSIL